VKIQDGCDRFCAYCVVPFARGKPRSRPADEILNEVRTLVAAGHREIVLTGICIGQYEREGTTNSKALGDLMRRAGGIDGLKRLRLSSIEPNDITDELLAAFAETPNFCPHLHVPLQSGDDDVLKCMNRRYTAEEFLNTVGKLRRALDNPSITSDVIVGFPTEGRAAFENTLSVCGQAGFSKIHIFPYSDRPGTAASGLKKRCHSREVSERFDELSRLELELALSYKRGFIGKRLEVLVESKREGPSQKLAGYTERYLKVTFDGPDELKGVFAQVEALSATPRRIEGSLAGA
jgi:threonylcarbamoyladenosine tRNA methylthiotransferase MtaB